MTDTLRNYFARVTSLQQDRRSTMLHLWRKGLTSTQIAAEVGATRSAVLGIVFRAREAGETGLQRHAPVNDLRLVGRRVELNAAALVQFPRRWKTKAGVIVGYGNRPAIMTIKFDGLRTRQAWHRDFLIIEGKQP